jgi:hypothetical protein
MEYVEGLDRARLVKAKGPLQVNHASAFIHQTAIGLRHGHAAGPASRRRRPLHAAAATARPAARVLTYGVRSRGCGRAATGGGNPPGPWRPVRTRFVRKSDGRPCLRRATGPPTIGRSGPSPLRPEWRTTDAAQTSLLGPGRDPRRPDRP